MEVCKTFIKNPFFGTLSFHFMYVFIVNILNFLYVPVNYLSIHVVVNIYY